MCCPTISSGRSSWPLDDIDHLKMKRMGTRIPVTAPQRVDDDLLEILAESNERKPLRVVTQINTAQEITPVSKDAFRRISKAVSAVLNQAVLLKGINDSRVKMWKLCETIQESYVRPYYIFNCSYRNPQFTHFRVPVERGPRHRREHVRQHLGRRHPPVYRHGGREDPAPPEQRGRRRGPGRHHEKALERGGGPVPRRRSGTVRRRFCLREIIVNSRQTIVDAVARSESGMFGLLSEIIRIQSGSRNKGGGRPDGPEDSGGLRREPRQLRDYPPGGLRGSPCGPVRCVGGRASGRS